MFHLGLNFFYESSCWCVAPGWFNVSAERRVEGAFQHCCKEPPLLVEKRKATLKVAELCKGAWCRRRSSHLFHLVVFRIAIHVGNQISVTSASSLLHGHDISIRRFPDLVHHVVVFCIFLVWDSCYTGSSLQAFQAPLSPTKLLLAIRSSYPRLNQFWPTDFCHLRRRSNFLICLIAIFWTEFTNHIFFLFGSRLFRKLGTRILLPPALLSKQQDSPQLPQWIVNPFRTTQAHQTRSVLFT